MRGLAILLVASAVPSCMIETYETFEMEPALPTPLDVLVVLDDTTAMASHLPRVPPPGQVGLVTTTFNGAPDVRIAVTTTTTGTLRTSAAVPTGVIVHSRRFEDGGMDTNYTGTLVEAVTSLSNVGASSTAPNTVLESTALALGTGFVRPSANLGILIVSASDDESPGDARAYAEGILARDKPTLVSLVHADSMQRLAEFVDVFAYYSLTAMDTYEMDAIAVLSSQFGYEPPDYCLPIAPSDVDSCELFTSHNHVVHPLPMCNGDPWQTPTPCWQLLPERSCRSGRALLLGGGYGMYRPRIIGRCLVAD